MIIRDATSADAAAIAGIINPLIRDTTVSFKPHELSDEEVARMIAAAPGYFVAEREGEVVGFASYSQFRGGTGYARTMEHTIMLAPAARGQGIGEALLRHVEAHARTAGVGSLWAGVSADNEAGRTFHAHMGYEEVAVLPKVGFKFGAWRDLTLMRKWLDPDGDDAGRTG